MARVTVPRGLRPQPFEGQGNFETIEVKAPVAQPQAGQAGASVARTPVTRLGATSPPPAAQPPMASAPTVRTPKPPSPMAKPAVAPAQSPVAGRGVGAQPPAARPVAAPVTPPPVTPPPARPSAVQAAPAEVADEAEERSDMAVIGPIAALVLALTISTLILDHPAARAVAAGLATVGLIAAVVIMMMAKKPKPGRHVARHAADPEATDRIAPGWAATEPRR